MSFFKPSQVYKRYPTLFFTSALNRLFLTSLKH